MQSSDIKYIGYGLGIGAVVTGLFFGGIFIFSKKPAAAAPNSLYGVQSTPTNVAIPTTAIPQESPSEIPATEIQATLTPAPTATFTATPTSLPTSTPIPSPTATFTTTEMMIANGEIQIEGPYSREQQIKLYESSLRFIAPTYEQAKQMSVLVNHVRFSDPSTTCGPLSISVLQAAGLLNEDFDAHDFFLLNPSLPKDRDIANKFFPPDLYASTRYRTRIDEFDWKSNPLMPGDFVYIYHGTGGNFDHMLVVNRVDAQGRAYSVTNYGTEQGFIINEAVLYDPNDPAAGLFKQWTKRANQELGSTGFSGVEIWRLK